MQHFTATDILTILTGFCLFAPIVFLPGYALGYLTDVLRFRTRTLAFRLAASVPLGISTGPITAYLLGRWLSLNAVLAANLALSLYTLYLAARAAKKAGTTDFSPSCGDSPQAVPPAQATPLRLTTRFSVFLALIAIWLIIALASLVDLQIGHRLYFPVIAFDYCVRTEFTQSIATYGIPAQNPFFFPGHTVALRYHYFWLILCALVERLGGGFVDARQALVAGSMWTGIGLIALVPLYLRIFSPLGATRLHRRGVIGIALLGVTGLDILGTLFLLWLVRAGLFPTVEPSVEWWNNQVDGWIYTMLWEPHYICALIACLTGFLILWDVPEQAGLGRRVVSGIIAGLAFSSAVGAGIYIALVFAAFLMLWTLIAITRKWYRETAALAISGAVALALSIPYLKTLTAAKGSGGQLFQLTVRSFDLAEILMSAFHLGRPWQVLAGDLVLLPLNYFLELGVFFVAGCLAWTAFRKLRRPPTRQELAGFTMAATAVLICTFVRSSVITNNDLGWRGFLIAQFILLLYAADLFSLPAAIPARAKSLLTLCLVLGAAGVVYDLAMLRCFPLLSDTGLVPKVAWIASDDHLGNRTYANREAYEWLRARTSPRAVIEQNPDVRTQDTFWGLYGQRQALAEDGACGTAFGGDLEDCTPVIARLKQLYAGGSAGTFESVCNSVPVDDLIAKDVDPAWQDRTSWVWKLKPIYQNNFVRIFPCAAASPPSAIEHN